MKVTARMQRAQDNENKIAVIDSKRFSIKHIDPEIIDGMETLTTDLIDEENPITFHYYNMKKKDKRLKIKYGIIISNDHYIEIGERDPQEIITLLRS